MIDITKPVQTRDGRPVANLRGQYAGYFVRSSKLLGYVGSVDGVECVWSVSGKVGHGRGSNLDLVNVPEKPATIDWDDPNILDKLQHPDGSKPRFRRIVAVDRRPGMACPVALMHDKGSITHYSLTGFEAGVSGRYDLVLKPQKVTRTIYLGKSFLKELESKYHYPVSEEDNVEVKIEYTR